MSIRLIASSTSLTASTTNANVGNPVTFTATVNFSASLDLSPGYQIRFFARPSSFSRTQTTLGYGTLDSSGVATYIHTFTTTQTPQIFAELQSSNSGGFARSSSSAVNMTIR